MRKIKTNNKINKKRQNRKKLQQQKKLKNQKNTNKKNTVVNSQFDDLSNDYTDEENLEISVEDLQFNKFLDIYADEDNLKILINNSNLNFQDLFNFTTCNKKMMEYFYRVKMDWFRYDVKHIRKNNIWKCLVPNSDGSNIFRSKEYYYLAIREYFNKTLNPSKISPQYVVKNTIRILEYFSDDANRDNYYSLVHLFSTITTNIVGNIPEYFTSRDYFETISSDAPQSDFWVSEVKNEKRHSSDDRYDFDFAKKFLNKQQINNMDLVYVLYNLITKYYCHFKLSEPMLQNLQKHGLQDMHPGIRNLFLLYYTPINNMVSSIYMQKIIIAAVLIKSLNPTLDNIFIENLEDPKKLNNIIFFRKFLTSNMASGKYDTIKQFHESLSLRCLRIDYFLEIKKYVPFGMRFIGMENKDVLKYLLSKVTPDVFEEISEVVVSDEHYWSGLNSDILFTYCVKYYTHDMQTFFKILRTSTQLFLNQHLDYLIFGAIVEILYCKSRVVNSMVSFLVTGKIKDGSIMKPKKDRDYYSGRDVYERVAWKNWENKFSYSQSPSEPDLRNRSRVILNTYFKKFDGVKDSIDEMSGEIVLNILNTYKSVLEGIDDLSMREANLSTGKIESDDDDDDDYDGFAYDDYY